MAVKADLAADRDIIDQVEGYLTVALQNSVEVAIIDDSADIVKFKSDFVLNILKLLFDVVILVPFNELIHRLIHFVLRGVLGKFAKVGLGNTAHQVLYVSVRGQSSLL